MTDLSTKEIEKFSNKILEDYDNKFPGLIFKKKKDETEKNYHNRVYDIFINTYIF